MRAILVPGFNIWDGGAATVGRLKPHLEAVGYEVVIYTYGLWGWRGLLGVRFMSGKDAKGLCDIYRRGDVVIGHSNGAHVTALAIELGMPVEHAIFIRPALDRDWTAPKDHPVKRIDVYYSPDDKAVWWAQWSPWKWGGMGRYGPTAWEDDSRLWPHLGEGGHSVNFKICPTKYLEPLRNG